MDNPGISPTAITTAEGTGGGVDARTGMVESAFITRLRSILIPGVPGQKGPWPSRELIRDPAKVRSQMNAMFGALFDRLELHEDLRKGPAGSAQRVVFDMLAGSAWPKPADKLFPVPPEYVGRKSKMALAFRRYEVSCALAIFYRAYNCSGVMGSPTDFPPKS